MGRGCEIKPNFRSTGQNRTTPARKEGEKKKTETGKTKRSLRTHRWRHDPVEDELRGGRGREAEGAPGGGRPAIAVELGRDVLGDGPRAEVRLGGERAGDVGRGRAPGPGQELQRVPRRPKREVGARPVGAVHRGRLWSGDGYWTCRARAEAARAAVGSCRACVGAENWWQGSRVGAMGRFYRGG
jgi:hypothetical protein